MATAFSPGSTTTVSTAAGLTPAGRPIDIPRICASLDFGRAQHPSGTTPKFGDLAQYGVSKENEKRVWAAEVRRLAAAVTDPGVTQLEGPAEWYGGDADANGYSCLHDLAHSFQMALEICTHDDLIVASRSHPQQDYSHPIALAYHRLERNFDDKIQRRKFEHLGRGGNRAFHAFVNYVTATVAIVLLRTVADDDVWADNCLATLAQFASKMKVVGYDLPIATAISMAVFLRSQPLLSPVQCTTTNPMDPMDPMDREPADAQHVVPLIAFNQTVQQLLRDATTTLLWDAATGQPSDMFETSAVLYDSGFHGARRQLCQERNRRIGSSAGKSTVRSASVVFDVCRAVWSDIPEDDRPVPCRTYVDWSWTSKSSSSGPATRRRSLTNMKDVISVLVPYTMFCGPFPSTLAALVWTSSAQQTPTNLPEPSTHLASVRIRTSQYLWLEAQMQDHYATQGPPHRNVYDTALAQERALARSEDDSMVDDDIKRRRYREMNERLQEVTAQMAHWTIGPHSITISDRGYCRTTCAAISLLMLGALVLIFIAGGAPLAGVDRPNLVVLVWTVAGFLMAYVKSMRVEAWPWHDFLRGQVVCRSVSDIHAVTKINPQTLLAALLWEANSMTIDLRTSGPFCSLFGLGAHDAGGFEIDIAPLNDTAMAGGHLFVVVSTYDGPALVDLVAPADAECYTAVPNVGSNTADGHLRDALYCINAGSPDHFLTFIREKDEAGRIKTRKLMLPMYRLSDNGVLEWDRVLGVLDERAIFR